MGSSNNSSAKTKKRVSLDTLWFAQDYGNIVSAYALYKTTEKDGCKPLMLNKPFSMLWDKNDDEMIIPNSFIQKYCDVSDVCYNSDDFAKIDQNTDIYLLGSGEVWNYNLCGKNTRYHYYLDYVPKNKKKAAYCSSFGSKYTGPYGEAIKMCAELLNNFSAISVSQYNDCEIMGQHYGIDPTIVMDPVFLCGKEAFTSVADNSKAKKMETDKSFIFAYIRRGSERKKQLVLRGNEILAPRHFSPMRNFVDIGNFNESRDRLGLECAYHSRVEDWLFYLINSEFIVTDDFHAVCLAVIFNKEFIYVENENYEDVKRVQTLLASLGIDDRIVLTKEDYKLREFLFRMPIRYHKVNKIMEKLIAESQDWLKNILA